MEKDIALALSLLTMMVALAAHRRASTRLKNLRRNCFLTNERGHRVRWDNAPAWVQESAEKGSKPCPA